MADVQSSPGSVAQVRETAAYLTRFAKTRGVAIVMVGARNQRWFAGWPESAGTLYRLFGAFWMAMPTPVFAPCAAIKTASAR